ncbi:hypothetical protein Vi05172_g9799 [Venturia inaequalis]|nr:hypothetical protein Vi05172_g9799 [Venturia inaequalis]
MRFKRASRCGLFAPPIWSLEHPRKQHANHRKQTSISKETPSSIGLQGGGGSVRLWLVPKVITKAGP